MLACFSALNESSNLETSGGSSEESEEIPEYQVISHFEMHPMIPKFVDLPRFPVVSCVSLVKRQV